MREQDRTELLTLMEKISGVINAHAIANNREISSRELSALAGVAAAMIAGSIHKERATDFFLDSFSIALKGLLGQKETLQ